MKIHYLGFFIFLFLAVVTKEPLFAGDKPDPDREVITIIQEKAEIPQPEGDLKDEAKFSEWFKKPLGLKQILWIALNRNPVLKAKLAEAQITVAEMRQLGLVESPEIEFLSHVPVGSPGFRTEYGVGVNQNLIDLIKLPSRKKIGRAEYESKKWEIAFDILQILTEVKNAYYQYQATIQLKAFWQSNLTAAQSAASLAEEQKKAGNISALDEAQHIAFLKTAQLEYLKSANEVKQARTLLAKQTGIPAENASWKIVEKLSPLPSQDPKLEKLKEWARIHRPDLLAQKYKIESKQYGVQLAKRAYLPQLTLGVHFDRDPEGNKGLGPELAFGLPLLGHRKVGIQKAQAELNASQQVLSAMEKNIPYDLEQLYQQLLLARQTVRFYQGQVLPVQARILEESLKHYNYMLLSNYQLLQSKQNQINAKREYIQALRDYWVAYAELENIVGGSLEGVEQSVPSVQ